MKAKLISVTGEVIEEFELPPVAPTPEAIADGRTNIVYKLDRIGSNYEYKAVPYLYIGDKTNRTLLDASGAMVK